MSIHSCEAEYYGMSDMAIDVMYYLQIFKELLPEVKSIKTLVDSEPGRRIASGDASLRKVKHLETRYHYVRDMAMAGLLNLQWITKSENVADILTKEMSNKTLFKYLGSHFLVDFDQWKGGDGFERIQQ